LQLEAEISLRVLHLPLEDLERRMAAFDEAAKQFEVERRGASDLLSGDRSRAFKELEAEAERVRVEGREVIRGKLEEGLAQSDDANVVRTLLTKAITEFFDTALQQTVRGVGQHLAATFAVHQRHADDLITLVRQTAADLFDIPVRAPAAGEAFEARRDPFWVTAARTVALSPFPPGMLDRVLPPSLRRKRVRSRLLEEIESVLCRNVENLRWATRQNLEDAFRRFGAELDERLALSLDATRGAMQAAFARRTEHSEAIEAEIAERNASLAKLQQIASALVPLG
jgi:hypothetical protein